MKTNDYKHTPLIIAVFLPVLLALLAAPNARAANGFETYEKFPRPAAGAFVVSGTSAPDGRLLLWDGNAVYRQFDLNTDYFSRLATGYPGDTAFVALAPDGHTVLLGQGFAGDIYRLDLNDPRNFSPASVVANIPGHFAGVFLTNNLVLLDVGRLDFTGSELQVIDVSGAKSTPRVGIAKGAGYFSSDAKALGVDKPLGSYSSSLAIDPVAGLVYAMDGNTRELRAFSVAALIAAYNTNTPLDWATDGTLIGSAGQFFSGGVAGVRPTGQLVIGGSAGFAQPGGVQIVDPSLANPASASVLQTLDPAGTQEFYYVIYNAYTDVITALVFSGDAFLPENLATNVPAAGSVGLALLAAGLGVAGIRRARRHG